MRNLAQAVMLLTFIQEVLCLNFGQDADYLHSGSGWLSSDLHPNVGKIPRNKNNIRILASSSIILQFDAPKLISVALQEP
jgi:hypothetical protein